MMVVIGIIAILGVMVVPGIKKAYGDFKIRETYDRIDSVISSMRSFYLVFNEPPSADFYLNTHADPRLAPFLSARLSLDPLNRDVYNGKVFWALRFRGNEHPRPYLFANVFRIGGYLIMIQYFPSNKPYYLEDFINRYEQKGCSIKHYEEGPVHISLPERQFDDWFR